VSVAVKAGTDIALEAADMILMKDDLKDLLIGFHISKTTYRLILFNFLFSGGSVGQLRGLPILRRSYDEFSSMEKKGKRQQKAPHSSHKHGRSHHDLTPPPLNWEKEKNLVE
jgi:hypothetical protein